MSAGRKSIAIRDIAEGGGVSDLSYRTWPWFDDQHRRFADRLEAWAAAELPGLLGDHKDVDAICRRLVAALGRAKWLDPAVPRDGDGFDLRSICLAREILARHAALADFAFAMQGLGTGAITLFGTPEQRRQWLPGPREGRHLTGFALSEPEAGSDVAAMQMTAREVSGGFRLDGVKTWISNGGIANQYVVFAKDVPKYPAFVLAAGTPGLEVAERIDVIAPHPLATLRFDNCLVPPDAVIGGRGAGMRVALATLDVFRPSVGAAALGLARRALDESLARATARPMFGGRLGDLQLTQAKIAGMATKIDAAALLVYRAAWARDCGGQARITREAAMAKLFATDAAQEIIDDAVQIWGAAGLVSGAVVENLYREIRAMRIYEGASEVQKIVIARSLLAPG
jgi:alkylation response protein AidB-like acyl-CoA dehydrogenase